MTPAVVTVLAVFAVTAGGLIFAAALAGAGTLGRAVGSPAGSHLRQREALAAEFRQRLAVLAVPVTTVVLAIWLAVGPR